MSCAEQIAENDAVLLVVNMQIAALQVNVGAADVIEAG